MPSRVQTNKLATTSRACEALAQLRKQRSEARPIKRLVLVQHVPDFSHHGGPYHLYSLLARVSCGQKPLKRLPRFGRITVTKLVLNNLQDRCFQMRIEGHSFIVWLANSSGYFARPAVLLSFISHCSASFSSNNSQLYYHTTPL